MKSYTALARGIADSTNKIFQYGSHDCFLFSFGRVEDMMGDHSLIKNSGFLGYTNLEEAKAIIEEHGGVENFAKELCEGIGMVEIIGPAKWGDVVLFEQNDEDTLGIVMNNEVYTSRVGVGVAKFPLDTIKRTWRYE